MTVHRFRHIQIATAIFLAACSVGTSTKSYPPAKGPAGAMVALELVGTRKMSGELLAVEEGALLLLDNRELVRVAIPSIGSGRAPKLSFTATTLNGQTRERLRLISRYPQGVNRELESRLLEAYGQSAVRVVS